MRVGFRIRVGVGVGSGSVSGLEENSQRGSCHVHAGRLQHCGAAECACILSMKGPTAAAAQHLQGAIAPITLPANP